jgi:glycosyltransferase involved in cell wall biosynthesis
MDTIFIASIFPKEREVEIRINSKCGTDNAANNFQWSLIEGLDFYFPNLKLITLPNIRTFPLNYKKIYFKKSTFNHRPDVIDYCLGFINCIFFKHFSKTIVLFKNLKNLINTNNKTTIFIYGVHSPFLIAAALSKSTNQNMNLCLIVPDLPRFMSDNKNKIYLLLKYIDSILIEKCLKYIDSFVLLNTNMKNELNVGDRPCTIVEGIYKATDDIKTKVEKNVCRTILYTGNIDERYGIKTLLRAFSLIKDDKYELWIRGSGNTKQFILSEAKLDKRIKYFEEMDKKDLIILQKRATVLINPISPKQEFTKYFFPSKTIDYMASGTPVIMTIVEGVPSEYYNYAYVIENDDAEEMMRAIIDVCSKDIYELSDFGSRASLFILEHKNPIEQVRKIYDMLNGGLSKKPLKTL